MTDYYASPTISLVLAWVFCVPILLGLIFFLLNILIQRAEGVPKLYMVWLAICIFVFSPLRYFILQGLVATSYPFQSVTAFLSAMGIIISIYIPIVFSLQYTVGIGLPLLLVVWIGGWNNPSKIRLVFSALIAPVILTFATILFFRLLPLPARTLHTWLNAKDLIRATNGPGLLFYKHCMYFLPIPYPEYADSQIASRGKAGMHTYYDDQRLYRSHFASFYLKDEEHIKYVMNDYPNWDEIIKEVPDE